jgi:SAM-dependent methyltransferase
MREGSHPVPYPAGLPELYAFTEPTILQAAKGRCRLLDVGCGEGHLARLLSERAHCSVVAFDVNPTVLAEACERNPGPTYLLGDAEDASFRAGLGLFDLILVRNVFHHFEDKEGFLKDVPHLLSPGGVLLLLDLDRESNYDPRGVLATHLTAIAKMGLWRGLKLMWRTRLFLAPLMRAHRREDIRRLMRQGWFTRSQVEDQLAHRLPGAHVRRLDGIGRWGGCYAVTWRPAHDGS